MNKNILLEAEERRIHALHQLNILDGLPEKEFQDIVELASRICDKPYAAISLLDRDRQWFKARVGLDLEQMPRDLSLGQFAVQSNSFFEIPDALENPAFQHHPLVVSGPGIRSYAGAPLHLNENTCIGTLCVMDRQPGCLSDEQKQHLIALANNAMQMFHLRKKMEELSIHGELLKALQRVNEAIILSNSDKSPVLNDLLKETCSLSKSQIGIIADFIPEKKEHRILCSLGIMPDEPMKKLFGRKEFWKSGEMQFLEKNSGNYFFLVIPIITDVQGKVRGVLAIGREINAYSKAEAEFLKPIFSTCTTLFQAIDSDEEKRKAEQKNEKIRQQLIRAQSIAKTGSWEYYVKDGIFHWSEEQYRIFELPPSNPAELTELAVKRVDPKDRLRAKTLSLELAKMGRPFSFRQKLIFEDGRTKMVRISGSPVMDDSGELLLIQGTCQDITEQRQRALDLQRFFELSLDLLCITDIKGKIIKNSTSFHEVLGYSHEEIRSCNLFELIHPEDINSARTEIKSMFQTGRLKNLRNHFFHKNGHLVLLEWTAAYDNDTNRIYASAKDLTGKAELEELLLQSKIDAEKAKAKDIFLANMSHEIRTPLNAIIGFNEILAQSDLSNDQRRKVDIISNASKTLSVIINDILDLSKLESGKLELDLHPFSIEDTCKQVIQLQTSRAKSKGIKLFFSYDNEIPEHVNGDEVRLTQILINLISNAIKFTGKGHVEIKVREAAREGNSSRIIFSVADTGIGIPKEKIQQVFERFSQAETYTTRLYGGTGLGLSIVKSLVELHNGQIKVKSRPGEGSVFSFSITYEISEETKITTVHKELGFTEKSKLLNGKRLLLVEDNEHNQLLASSLLEKYGIIIEIAGNGNQALETLREKEFDFILMDLQMPILDGISTTIEIRKQLGLSTPVIACSAHAMSSERRKCLESGMNDYISKPYTEMTVVQSLLNFVSRDNILESQVDGHKQTDQNASQDGFQMNGKSERSQDWLEKSVISKIPEDVRVLSEAMQKQDWPALEFKAHNLISSLAILEQAEGIQLSRKLESASHEQDQNKSIILGKELIEYLSKLTGSNGENNHSPGISSGIQ